MGLLNTLTSPLGIKLEKGGPYPDAGYGDKAEQAMQQYVAQIMPLLSQLATVLGLANPVTGDPGTFQSNPYVLSPAQQGNLNTQLGLTAQDFEDIKKKVASGLSTRGLAGEQHSNALRAADAYLRSQMIGQQGMQRAQAGNDAYDKKMQGMNFMSGLLGNVMQAKTGMYQQQAQNSMAKTQMAHSNLGQLIGAAIPYLGGLGTKPGTKPGGFASDVDMTTSWLSGGGGGGGNMFTTGDSVFNGMVPASEVGNAYPYRLG